MTHMVRIKQEEGITGLFYATSPDLKGLLVAELSIEALENAIPLEIAKLYEACDEKVIVTSTSCFTVRRIDHG